MKSDRRSDSGRETPPSPPLEGFGDYWREYGNRVLLVAIVAVASFWAVRFWNDRKAREAADVASALEVLENQPEQFRDLEVAAVASPANVFVDRRERLVARTDEAINTILNSSKDPRIVARAWLCQGDADWNLANLPDPVGADTQPSLKTQNRDTILNDARTAYSNVLNPPYSDEPLNVFAARMGLAAVAENLGQWDDARKQYQAILDTAALPDSFKDLARTRLDGLAQEQKPALLEPPPAMASALGSETPSTAPATTGPIGPPIPEMMNLTTQPATRAAEPTTRTGEPTTPLGESTSRPAESTTRP